MALPSTIKAGTGSDSQTSPPHKSSGGNYYSLVIATLRQVHIYKATDPTSTWTEQDGANAPAILPGGGERHKYITTHKQIDSDLLHIAVGWGIQGTVTEYLYHTFDMATDSWVITDELIENIAGSEANAATISLVYRPLRSAVIVVYSGATDRIMGGDKERADLNIRLSGTWSGPQSIDVQGDLHYGNPTIVLGNDSSVNTQPVHVFMQRQTDTAFDPPVTWGSGVTQGRTWDYLDDTWLAGVDNSTANSGSNLVGYPELMSYDDAGTWRVIAAVGQGSNTISTAQGIEDGQFNQILVTGAGASQSISSAPMYPWTQFSIDAAVCTFVELNGDLHCLYAGGGTAGVDQDIYYTTSTDNGDTWATPTEELNGVSVVNISANIYVRGTDTVMAYAYQSGTTYFYNEKILIAGNDLTLTADGGSVTATGVAANLEQGYKVTSDAGSVALTGIAATLHLGYSIAAAASSYLIDAIAASLKHKHSLLAAPDSVVITGVIATLAKNKTIAVDAGNYSIAGVDANLEQGYSLASDTGAVTITGSLAGLEQGYSVTAVAGAVTLTGIEAGLNKSKSLIAAAGAVTITGVEAALLRGKGFNANAGSFAITGVSTNYVFTLGQLAYSEDCTLWPAPTAPAGVNVTRTTTTFEDVSVTRQQYAGYSLYTAIGLSEPARKLTFRTVIAKDAVPKTTRFAQISVLMQGSSNNSWYLDTSTGEAVEGVLAGTDPFYFHVKDEGSNWICTTTVTNTGGSTNYYYRIHPAVGVYSGGSWTPTNATLGLITTTKTTYSFQGGFDIWGADTTGGHQRILTADPGSCAITGFEATLTPTEAAVLTADPGSYLITGLPVNQSLAANVGSYVISGAVLNFRYFKLSAEPGLVAIGNVVGRETAATPIGGNLSNSTSVDVGTNLDRFLVVGVSTSTTPTGIYPTTITYAGEALTIIHDYVDSVGNQHTAYGLVNPTAGSNTLLVEYASPGYMEGPVITAQPFYNVVQTSVAAAVRDSGQAKTNGNGSTVSINLTGVIPTDMTVGSCYNYHDTATGITYSTLTEQSDATFTSQPAESSAYCEGAAASDLGVSTVTWTTIGATANGPGVAFALIAVTEAALTYTKGIAADAGSVLITGIPATLTDSGSSPILAADAGAVAITGIEAALLRGKGLNANTGSFAINGVATSFLKTYAVTAEIGATHSMFENFAHPSEDFTQWGGVGVTSTEARVVGDTDTSPHGTLTADSIEDDYATAFSSLTSVRPTPSLLSVTYPLIMTSDFMDGEIFTGSVYIKKDSDVTFFPLLSVTMSGGGTQWATLLLNRDTGEFLTRFIGTGFRDYGVVDVDANWWQVWCSVQTITGATGLSFQLYPAYNDIFDSPGNASEAVGTIKAWGAQLYRGTYKPGYLKSDVPFGPTFIGAQRKLTADAGSFAITGIDANLEQGYAVTSDTGSYVVTGFEATLTPSGTSPVLTADAGVYTINGVAAGLEQGYSITIDAGSFAINGVEAALLRGKGLNANTGVYVTTGFDANLEQGYLVTSDTGSYTITGFAATLTPSGTNPVLAADTGSVSINGLPATLTKNIPFLANAGSYTINGVATNLEQGYVLTSDTDSYVITGIEAALLRGKGLNANAGSYVVTGAAATLSRQVPALSAEAGSYLILGVAAALEQDHLISVVNGAYTINGVAAGLTKNATAAAGGVHNAAEFFPTGQSDVVITLYDPEADGAVPVALDSNVCVEVGTTGLYMWDISKITTLPQPRKEYGYLMTDGSTSSGGVIIYDDFLTQYLIHEEYRL